MDTWSLYIVRCGDGTLYTGITTDPERRLAQHRAGEGARYLRGRGPLIMVFQKELRDKSEALRMERLVKRLPKNVKEALCTGTHSIFTDLLKALRERQIEPDPHS